MNHDQNLLVQACLGHLLSGRIYHKSPHNLFAWQPDAFCRYRPLWPVMDYRPAWRYSCAVTSLLGALTLTALSLKLVGDPNWDVSGPSYPGNNKNYYCTDYVPSLLLVKEGILCPQDARKILIMEWTSTSAPNTPTYGWRHLHLPEEELPQGKELDQFRKVERRVRRAGYTHNRRLMEILRWLWLPRMPVKSTKACFFFPL